MSDQPIKIFLIDDDKFLLDMYTLKLSKANFAVESSSAGNDALKRLHDGYQPDIILLDIIMPHVDGLEILQTIRKENLAPHAIIIMLSNQADDARKATELGAAGFIVKATNIPSEVVKQVQDIYTNKKENNMIDYKKEIDELVNYTIEQGASDLHLSEGRVPMIRASGSLLPLVKKDILSRADIKGLLDCMIDQRHKEVFLEKKEVDFAYDHKGQSRFRGNAYLQMGKICVALRFIPKKIRDFKELHLPDMLETFANKKQGFFLCVGPTGQGKSTTLAAMVEHINTRRLEHIITIEDPIEYLFESKQSIIDQREVGEDTESFQTALHNVFREDIDVLMVGEMRDPDTIATAVTAAETGHLVFSTLHTNSAAQTVARIIDSFNAEQQNQIRIQLSASLIGIFSQRLIPRVAGGVVPAYELLINTPAVANVIRENRTHEIANIIETGMDQGMIDFNRTLSELVRSGEISIENAYANSLNSKALERMI